MTVCRGKLEHNEQAIGEVADYLTKHQKIMSESEKYLENQSHPLGDSQIVSATVAKRYAAMVLREFYNSKNKDPFHHTGTLIHPEDIEAFIEEKQLE